MSETQVRRVRERAPIVAWRARVGCTYVLERAPRWSQDRAASFTGHLQIQEIKHHTEHSVTFLGHSVPDGEWVVVEVSRKSLVGRLPR